MDLPDRGARLRAGTYATVVVIEPPNTAGNVRCIVRDDHGQLGWIMYYAGGTRSNINFSESKSKRPSARSCHQRRRMSSGREAE